MAGSVNPEGLCQMSPLLSVKTKLEQKVGFAAAIGMIGRKQIIRRLPLLNPSVSSVRQFHLFCRLPPRQP